MRPSKAIAAEVAAKLSPRARQALVAMFGDGPCNCKHPLSAHNRLVMTLNATCKKDNGMHRPCSMCDCKAYSSTFRLRSEGEYGRLTTELVIAKLVRADWNILSHEHIFVLERLGKFVVQEIKKAA